MADGIAAERISDGKGLLTAEVVGGVILHSLTVTLRLGESRDVVLGLADMENYFRRRDAEFAPPKNTCPAFSVRGSTLIVEYPNGTEPDGCFFFNLKGHGVGNIEDHNLTIFAERYMDAAPVFDAGKSGKADGRGNRKAGKANWQERAVADTPFDFRKETPIGERIRIGFEPLVRQGGYDHVFVLRRPTGDDFLTEGRAEKKAGAQFPLTHAATLMDRMRTLQMDVYTSFPALHLYTGNRMSGKDIGKGGCIYPKRGGVALLPCGLPEKELTDENPTDGNGQTAECGRTEYRFKSLL